jgi:hypothetical protein
MTPARRNLFKLAENLGCFVSDIESRMMMREYMEWIQFYKADPAPAAAGVELSADSFGQLKEILS